MEQRNGSPEFGEDSEPSTRSTPGASSRFTHPLLTRFIERVEQHYRERDAESFWALEDDFRQIVHSDVVLEFLKSDLTRMVETPARMGEWRPNQVIIHRGRGYALSVWMIEEQRSFIHSTSFLGMCAPIGRQSLHYSVYKYPGNYDNSVFDAGIKLDPAGAGLTGPGGILLLQSQQYAYDFHVTKPQPVLKFATASQQPMEWLFSKDNLHAWQANDSELVWTQLRVAAYVLGRLADESSVEPLEQLTSHSHHAVRWAAIQNLGRLSRSAVMSKLQDALTDPHAHIRKAAAKTLRQFTPKA